MASYKCDMYVGSLCFSFEIKDKPFANCAEMCYDTGCLD